MIVRKENIQNLFLKIASTLNAIIFFFALNSELIAQAVDHDANEALLRSANISFETGDFESAIAQYSILYDRFPNDPSINNNYSAALFQAGHHAEAAALIQRFLSNHSEVGEITNNLLIIYDYMASESYALLNGTDAELPELRLSDSVPNIPTDSQPNSNNLSANDSAQTRIATEQIIDIRSTDTPQDEIELTTSISSNDVSKIALPEIEENLSVSVNPDESKIIENRLNAYMNAWREGDVKRYLSFYYPSISPVAGVSYNDWYQSRIDRIYPERQIELAVEDLNVHFESEEDLVMEYIQRYRSRNYNDRTLKQMRWRKYQGVWYIRNEKSLPR